MRSQSNTWKTARATQVFVLLISTLLVSCQKSPSPKTVVTAPPPSNTPAPTKEVVEPSAVAPANSPSIEPAATKDPTTPAPPSVDNGQVDGAGEPKPLAENTAATVAQNSVKEESGSTESVSSGASNNPRQTENGEAVTAKVTDSQPTPTIPTPHERFLVLTPSGPVVIDLMITLQGAGYGDALARLVEEAFKVADEDGDGQATWKAALDNPKFRSGQFGNLVAENDDQRQQLIRIYDSDRDEMVDREELPRFLTRNSGGGRSFSLRSSNEYRSSNRSRSPTRLLLDANRDGAITAAEMDAAPTTLLNRDADDDEIVVLAELKNSIDTMAAPVRTMSNRNRTDEPDAAIWLTNPSIDLSKRWRGVQFRLQELYSYGEIIRVADWPLTSELFQQMDANGDGSLQQAELAKLLDVPPHLVIEAVFDGGTEQDRGPRIKLRQLSSELAALKPSVRELPTRLSLQLPDVELEFFVNEDPSLSSTAQAAKNQFTALDKDKNGYLEKSEVPEQLPGLDATFESFDANGDGKVYEPEVAAYLEQRGAVSRSQVRARVADQEDALFTAIDTDGDGRLNTREIREVPARLRAFDRNGDAILQSHEIPGSMVVGFVRGNSQQDAQLFSGPAMSATPQDTTIPRWFRGMDANGDGEISRREFFGDQDQFNRIDQNQDGFILAAEAQATAQK